MSKAFPLALLISMLFSCNSIQRLYTLYPETKNTISNLPNEPDVIRIYFDRKGYIYPETDQIKEADLRKSDGRLQRFYHNNAKAYKAICDQYQVKDGAVDDNTPPYAIGLQDKIIRSYVDRINAIAAGRQVVFIIHGFNSSPYLPGKTSSYDEFEKNHEAIRRLMDKQKFLFADVYWDGMSADQGYHNFFSEALNGYRVWPHAQVSATYAGMELRRILSGLRANDIDVVTHSHGAGVITTALFDNYKFNKLGFDDPHSFYNNPDSWLYTIQSEYNRSEYATPAQQYHVGMLAPAIPGTAVFKDYYRRTVNGKLTFTQDNNYHFIVGFNRYDKVTTKFYLLARGYGSTTLACKPAELAAVRALFTQDKRVIDSVDFSNFDTGGHQDNHDWLVYLGHLPQISQFLQKTIP